MSDQQTQGTEVLSTSDALNAVAEAATEALEGKQEEGSAESEQQTTQQEETPKKQDDRLASKFAALSRKEKQIRERERAIEQRVKQMEEQLKSKEEEYTSKYINPERFKKEPLKVLEEVGLNFNQLAEMIVNDGKPTAEMQAAELENKITAKIKELEAKLAEKEAKEQEAKYEQTLQNFMGEITAHVNSNNDYELIRANDAVDLVYDVIEARHAETGELLSIKEASDAVESYLLDEAKKQLSLGKIKGLLAPQVQQEAPKGGTGKASVTLSNTIAAQVPKTNSRRLSDDESKQEAAKLIRWEE